VADNTIKIFDSILGYNASRLSVSGSYVNFPTWFSDPAPATSNLPQEPVEKVGAHATDN
jgi:hypothetical protein